MRYFFPEKLRRGRKRHGALVLCLASALSVTAVAQTLRWDPDPLTAGAQGGSGDWDGGLFWLDANEANVAWVSGADAQFSGLAGSVDASGVTVDDITNSNTYSLVAGTPGGVLTIGGSDGETAFGGSGTLWVQLPMVGQNGVKVDKGLFGNTVHFEAANLYGGDTHIASGTLQVSGGSAIPDSSTVVLGAAGVARLTVASSETIGGLSGGTGTVSLTGSAHLTVGANNLDTVFAGSISGGSSSNRVIKTGSGNTTFAGGFVTATLEIQSGKWIAQNAGVSYNGIIVGQAGVLEVDGGNLSATSLTGLGEVKLGAGTLSLGGFGGTFSGTISGSGNVTISGTVAGRTLAGTNSFTGVLSIINGGDATLPTLPPGTSAVNLGSGTLISSLSLTSSEAIVSDRSIVLGGTANKSFNITAPTGEVTVQGLVSGSGPFQKGGAGTLILSNPNNSFTGSVTVATGKLSVPTVKNAGVNSELGTGSTVVLSGGTLAITDPGTQSTDRTFALQNSQWGTLEISGGTTLALHSSVVGSGHLRKSGNGTLILNNANSYSLLTEIIAGKLVTQHSNGIPDGSLVTVAAGAELQVQASETIGGLSGAGLVEIGSNILTLRFAGSYSGQISGAGQLIYSGLGGPSFTQTLTGNNSFSAGLLVNGGYIAAPDFGSEGAPGPLGSGPVTLNGGGLRYSGTAPFITNRPITLGSAGGFLAAGSAPLTVQSLLTGDVVLTIGSGGTVVLENPANSFTKLSIQGTLETSEILDAGVISSLGSGSAVTITGPQGRLRFTGNVNNSSNRMLVYQGTATIEVADPDAALQMDAATGAGGLVKAGPGTLVQTSPLNDFTGPVTLQEGVLQTGKLENSGVLSALGRGSQITFSGGQLSLESGTTASTNRTIALSGGGRIQGNGNTTSLTGTINGQGWLTFAGADASSDTFVLNGVNTSTATFIVDKATVRVTSASGLSDSSAIHFADGGGGVVQLDVPETLGSITGATGAGAGRLILNAPLTVNVNAPDVSSVGARIEGSGTVTKIGAGIMALLGANTFTGNVLISRGTLFIPQWTDDAAPPLGKGSVVTLGSANASPQPRFEYGGFATNTINHQLSLAANGGEVRVPQPSATLVWAGSVEGATSAELRKTGPGALRLSGANGYAGATRIEEGKLQVIGSNALPNSGIVHVSAGAALELLPGTNETIGALLGEGSVLLGGQRLTVGTNESTSFDGVLSGSGQSRFEKRGSGTLTLSNPLSSFTGGVSVTDGGVSVPYLQNAGTNSPLGSAGPISLGDAVNHGRLIITSATPGATNRPIILGDGGGTIEVSHHAAEVVLTGSISGTGALLKLGLGRMRFGSQFAGQIVVANGTFAPSANIAGSVTAINPGRVESINGVTHHLGGLVLAGGAAAPGGSGIAGVLHAGQVSVHEGVFELDLFSAAAGDYDQLVLTGALELAGPLELAINLKFDPVDRVDVFRIVLSGSSTTFGEPNALISYQGRYLADGDEFLVNSGGYSQFFGVRYDPSGESGIELFAAPEPGTATLLLGGLACVVASRRRRRDAGILRARAPH